MRPRSWLVILPILLLPQLAYGQGKTPSLKELRAQLKDKEAGTRRQAARALGKMKSKAAPAVPDLLQALVDHDPYVRNEAAYSLGYIGPKAAAAIPIFLKILQDKKQIALWGAATWSLGQMGPQGKAALPVLDKNLSSRHFLSRAESAGALANLEKSLPEALSILKRALTSPSRTRRLMAAYGFGAMGPRAAKALPELKAALFEKDDEVRVQVIQSIGKIKSGAAPIAPALIEYLAHENWRTTEATWRCLVEIGGKASPALCKGLSNEKSKIRKQCAVVLGRLGPKAKSAIPALVKALKDSKPEVRDAAIDALQSVVLTPVKNEKKETKKPTKKSGQSPKKKKRAF